MPSLPKTTMVRKEDTSAQWFVLDADGHIVGRLASRIATVLMGKHKACYTPHVDNGDYVIVLNADKIRFSGASLAHPRYEYHSTKMENKTYDRYTGYPSGRKVLSGIEVWERSPERILQEAVRRMLPKNKLGRHMLKKLKLFVGTSHPHQAQQPVEMPAHLMPPKK